MKGKEKMKISFKNGNELEVQAVEQSGNSLHISVINQTVEKLVEIFSNEAATEKIITNTGEAYEGYTEYAGINISPGMIFGVTLYSKGKTPEERMKEVEETTMENSEQMTQAQEAICELYEMVLGGDA